MILPLLFVALGGSGVASTPACARPACICWGRVVSSVDTLQAVGPPSSCLCITTHLMQLLHCTQSCCWFAAASKPAPRVFLFLTAAAQSVCAAAVCRVVHCCACRALLPVLLTRVHAVLCYAWYAQRYHG
jgi:hypothetical protein